MLGKTAGGLYWMARYLERSENTARLVEAGQRMALTRSGAEDEWSSILQTATSEEGYLLKYDEVTREHVIDWLLRDPDNPSSVLSVVSAARHNARLVRTAITREVWESVNLAWMELKKTLGSKIVERDLPEVLASIRQRAAFVRGAMLGTMMRDDIYDFARLGTFLERADNTARILDVKYYVLLPSAMPVGSSLDNVQWETILRSVSAEGGFRMAYGRDVRPREIAQFLLLDSRMPRSLRFCSSKIRDNLNYLSKDYSNRMESHDLADALYESNVSRTVDGIIESGLHEYIQDFLGAAARLGRQIEIDYRFYE
ncbi:MAG: alpha-E domain-containing protein [Rhodobacteraceae bacterium]|nr:alpha-E domain-containing protein [Paracoccaceae bacterium]